MASENWDAEQDETGCQQPAGPVRCANNCGFFGSPATMNLCSKCYRDAVLHKVDAAAAAGERPVSPLFGDTVLFPSIPGKFPDVTASSAGKSDGENFLFGENVLFPSIPGKLSDVTASSGGKTDGEGFLFGENDYVVRDFKGKPKCWKSDMPENPFGAFRNTCEGACGSGEEVAPVLDLVLEKNEQPAKVANRCCACKKRVGLTGFKCRCGDTFCALHRYSDKHNCKFDYKAVAQEAIAKANPVVKANKVDKI